MVSFHDEPPISHRPDDRPSKIALNLTPERGLYKQTPRGLDTSVLPKTSFLPQDRVLQTRKKLMSTSSQGGSSLGGHIGFRPSITQSVSESTPDSA